MDAIPYNFVDAVVELFAKKTLSRFKIYYKKADKNCIWKDAIDLHSQNRRYFTVFVNDVPWDETQVEVYFIQPFHPVTIEEPQQVDGRFLRFTQIETMIPNNFADPLVLKTDDFKRLLSPRTIGSARLRCFVPSKNVQKLLFEGPSKKACFAQLHIAYAGRISEDFLKAQIDCNPLLRKIKLEETWPDTILPHLEKFGLSPSVRREFNIGFGLKNEYIEEALELWKTNEYYECTFTYTLPKDTANSLRFLRSMQLQPSDYKLTNYYVLHEARKSIVTTKVRLFDHYMVVFSVHNFCGSCDTCDRYWPVAKRSGRRGRARRPRRTAH